MDGEIILDRGNQSVMKLDDNEQAMMDEIQLDFAHSRTHAPPTVQRMEGRQYEPQSMGQQEDVDAFANPVKQNAPPPPQAEEPVDHGEYMDDTPYNNGPGMDYSQMEPQEDVPSPGYKTIDEEKSDLVNKLGRLEKRGFNVNKRLNAYSPVDELRTEVKRITYSIDVDKSIKFSRRMLVACVTGLEFLNKRYNPFEIQLEGWSENVMETQDDYDEVFKTQKNNCIIALPFEFTKSSSEHDDFLDGTKWEEIDRIGNKYNRLAIWDAKLIHAASQYFGKNLNDSRLFHMFFFDIKQ